MYHKEFSCTTLGRNNVIFENDESPVGPWLIIMKKTALNCTAQQFSLLHCTLLHCIDLYYTAFTTLHCTAQHCTALYCTTLHCFAQKTAVQCSALHRTALHCTALRCTALCYTILKMINMKTEAENWRPKEQECCSSEHLCAVCRVQGVFCAVCRSVLCAVCRIMCAV